MATVCSDCTSSSYFAVFVLLILLLSQLYTTSAISHTTVKFLPGLEGPLPFHLETGYVGVGESDSEDVQLFYYFVKSQRNPKHDPLLLWLTGGPGCSVLSGLAFEIGPFAFKQEEYNGSVPSLVLNPHTWTKVSSIIFLDLPVNTGFSYTKLPVTTERSDTKQIQHANQFIRKWLIDHPEFLSNKFYIAGDSYSGIIVPPLAFEIVKGNDDNIQPSINYQGFSLGNAFTNTPVDHNSRVPFAHGMGLISDELYESLKSSCGGEYKIVDPSNEKCARDIAAFQKLVSGVERENILEPLCPVLSPKPQQHFGARSLDELSVTSLPAVECRSYKVLLANYWANDKMVRKALGIRQGSIGKWERCIKNPYISDMNSTIPFHVKLGSKGYRSLIYSGDHDMIVPFCGTEAWIRSLNYSVVDEWRPWLVQGQVAGYTRKYSNGITFATVKGGGHTAPEHKPKECFPMFERWISQKPL